MNALHYVTPTVHDFTDNMEYDTIISTDEAVTTLFKINRDYEHASITEMEAVQERIETLGRIVPGGPLDRLLENSLKRAEELAATLATV